MGLHNSFMNSTISCSGNKEVDLDALNLLASGAYDCLCPCSYVNEKGHHRFAYKTETLTHFVHIRAGLTFEEAISLLSAGVSALRVAQKENLVLDNFKLSKEYIFCTQKQFKLVYIPIICKGNTHNKDFLLKLLGAIHIKDARISQLKKDIRNLKNEAQILERTESFVKSFTVTGNFAEEGETTILGQPAAPAEEGETTILSQPAAPAEEGETTILSQSAAPAEEGETTVLSQPAAPAEEGETTVLSQYSAVAEEGETSLLSQELENEGCKTVYSQEPSEKLTAFLQNESSEYETTVLSAQPQERQHTVITTQDGAFLFLVRNSTGEKIPVEITPFAIGKDPQNVDYVLHNDSVSRCHATIVFENSEYYIVDNGSTNGTMIEGIRLQPGEKAELENGYIISIGNETFQALLERR